MTGDDIRAVLLHAVAVELEACAQMADDLGDRLTRSGKPDEAMVAVTLAAQIRDRKQRAAGEAA